MVAWCVARAATPPVVAILALAGSAAAADGGPGDAAACRAAHETFVQCQRLLEEGVRLRAAGDDGALPRLDLAEPLAARLEEDRGHSLAAARLRTARAWSGEQALRAVGAWDRLAALEARGPLADPAEIVDVRGTCRELGDRWCEARARIAESEAYYQAASTEESGRPAALAAQLLRRAGPSPVLARALFLSRGYAEDESGRDADRAVRQRTEAIEMARAFGEASVEGRALCVQAGDFHLRRRFDEARAVLDRLDEIRSAGKLPRVDACAAYQRGVALFYQGRAEEAYETWRAFVETEAARAAPREQLWILIGLGGAAVGRPVAIDWLERALDLAGTLHGESDRMAVSCNLSSALVSQWLVDEAEQPARTCLELARRTADRRFAALGRQVLGRIALRAGRIVEALPLLEAAVAAGRESNEAVFLGWSLISLGTAVARDGRRDEARAILDEAITLSDRIGWAEMQAFARIALSGLHLDRGRADDAEGAAQEALDLLGPGARPAIRAFSLRARCRARIGQQRYGEALHDAREQLALIDEAGIARERAATLIDLANIHHYLYRLDRAAGLYEQAILAAREVGAVEAERIARSNLILQRARVEALPADIAFLRSAIEESLAEEREPSAVSLSLVLANALDAADDLPGAEEAARHALELATTCCPEGTVYRSRRALVSTLVRAGKVGEALAHCSLLDESADTAPGPDVMTGRWSCGVAHELAGQPAAALRELREAVRLAEAARGRLVQPELKASYLGDRTAMYADLARAVLAAAGSEGDARAVADVVALWERARARVLLESLALGAAGADGDPEAPDPRSSILADMARLHMRAASAEAGESARLLEEIRRLEDRLGEQVTSASLLGAQPADLASIRSSLPDGTAALVYLLGSDERAGSLLVVVDRRGARAHRLSVGREELWAAARTFRALLERRSARTEWDQDAIRAMGRKLFGKLLTPIAARIGGGIRHLVVVPDGPLEIIPFEALVLPGGAGDARYLVEEVEVTRTPSLSLRAQLDERRVRTGGREATLVAFANPDTPDAPALDPGEQALWASVFPAGLPPLPYSEEEVVRASRHVGRGAEVVLGSQVTEEAVRSALVAGHAVVHVAAHGFLDAASIGRSGVVLTPTEVDDGLLQAREIVDLGSRAGLVVLSGCSTGGQNRLIGLEGPLGLPHALFQAGVPAVVMSLWDVRDRAATVFMDRFYAHLAGGRSPSAALRNAKLDMLRSDREELAHPSVWAPFVLSGVADRPLGFPRAGRCHPAPFAVVGVLLALAAGLWWLSRRFRRH